MRRRSPPSPTATRCCAVRRGYLLRAGIEERPVLDWPHLARRVQVAKTTAKGLRALTEREYRARPAIRCLLDSLHWRLWNGQTDRARDAPVQKIGRAHVCTPVTNEQLVCRLLLEKKKRNRPHRRHKTKN